MRILRLNDLNGPWAGGAEKHVRSVASALEKLGHPNHIFTIVSELPSHQLDDETYFQVPRLGWRRVVQDLVDTPGLEKALRHSLDEFKPDLIHLHHFRAGFTSLGRELVRHGLPIVVTVHDAELICPIATLVRPGNIICDGGIRPRCLFTGCHVHMGGIGGPYNLWQSTVFKRRIKPSVRAYICPSLSMMNYMDSNGFVPAVHLPSVSESGVTVPPPPPAHEPPSIKTVGFLGRLIEGKGVSDLLRAFAFISQERSDLRLSIGGDGVYRPQLVKLANSLGIAHLTQFEGELQGSSKSDWFRRVNVVVVPSRSFEHRPFVIQEAFWFNRPVVGTRVGGIPELVEDGATGWLVPVGSTRDLANSIVVAIDNPERARAMAEEGRRRLVKSYRPASHVVALMRVYSMVLRGEPLASRLDALSLVRQQ